MSSHFIQLLLPVLALASGIATGAAGAGAGLTGAGVATSG